MPAEAPERLAGGVAVVTGAARGLGEGIALAAAAAGMRLVLADIDAAAVAVVAERLRAGGTEAIAVATDVRDPAAMERLAQATRAAFGATTLLVNNAGIETLGRSWDIPADRWRSTIEINLLGAVNGVRAFLPDMLDAGRPAWIANVSSVGGFGMMPLQAPYIVSKHALLSFTECLALEVDGTGKPVSVSAVMPGPIRTGIFDDAARAADEAATHHRHMQAMLRDHGMPAVDAGRLILAGIAAGDFWISTHPEMMRDAAHARSFHLAALARPRLTAEASAALG